jgi:hypothetical protein
MCRPIILLMEHKPCYHDIQLTDKMHYDEKYTIKPRNGSHNKFIENTVELSIKPNYKIVINMSVI